MSIKDVKTIDYRLILRSIVMISRLYWMFPFGQGFALRPDAKDRVARCRTRDGGGVADTRASVGPAISNKASIGKRSEWVGSALSHAREAVRIVLERGSRWGHLGIETRDIL